MLRNFLNTIDAAQKRLGIYIGKPSFAKMYGFVLAYQYIGTRLGDDNLVSFINGLIKGLNPPRPFLDGIEIDIVKLVALLEQNEEAALTRFSNAYNVCVVEYSGLITEQDEIEIDSSSVEYCELFQSALDAIKKDAIQVLGYVSFERFLGFLDGFSVYDADNVQLNSVNTLLSGFSRFVENKYNPKATIGYGSIISLIVHSDKEAFDLFFSLFEEFIDTTRNE